jgi:hypothetical protein
MLRCTVRHVDSAGITHVKQKDEKRTQIIPGRKKNPNKWVKSTVIPATGRRR